MQGATICHYALVKNHSIILVNTKFKGANVNIRFIFLFVISFSTLLLSACGGGDEVTNSQDLIPTGSKPGFDLTALTDQINSLPIETLSDEEKSDLIFMREEEKLARDSYDTLYDLWGQTIFDNISDSEQVHMESVLIVLNKYGLEDPAIDDVPAYFVDYDLQVLYDYLMDLGDNSLVDALMVGAEIEEVDIVDLEIRIARTDNQDIQLIYENLMKGSRNHLRSFVSNLEKQNVIYVPKHLSQDEYDAIINSPMEKG